MVTVDPVPVMGIRGSDTGWDITLQLSHTQTHTHTFTCLFTHPFPPWANFSSQSNYLHGWKENRKPKGKPTRTREEYAENSTWFIVDTTLQKREIWPFIPHSISSRHVWSCSQFWPQYLHPFPWLWIYENLTRKIKFLLWWIWKGNV